MKHAEKNPEIRPNRELPLFEQSFYKFEQQQAIAHDADIPQRREEVPMMDEPLVKADSRQAEKRPTNKTSNTKFLYKNLETSTAAGSSDGPADKANARKTDRPTSHMAAASVSLVNLGRTKNCILSILRTCGPQTDEQIAKKFLELYGEKRASPSGLRSRRSWLVDQGFVEAAGGFNEDGTTWGITGKTASKRNCLVWRLRK